MFSRILVGDNERVLIARNKRFSEILGPGEYWIPIALQTLGFEFTYNGIGLNKSAEQSAKTQFNWSEDHKNKLNIYVAFETIEHLHNEHEIREQIERLGIQRHRTHRVGHRGLAV